MLDSKFKSYTSALALAASISTLTLGMAGLSQADSPGPLFALVDTAAQRLQTADPVAAAKFETGNPIDDPQREQQVIDTVVSAAAEKHIDAEYITRIFRNQIDATSALEHARFAQWKLNSGAAPAAAPELTPLRVNIDRLDQITIEGISAQWDSLNSPSCGADLDNARRAVLAARQVDHLFRQALTYATHSYCRGTN